MLFRSQQPAGTSGGSFGGSFGQPAQTGGSFGGNFGQAAPSNTGGSFGGSAYNSGGSNENKPNLGGGFVQGKTNETTPKKEYSQRSRTLLPVTIRQVLDAQPHRGDESVFAINGIPCEGQISLLGLILSVQAQSTRTVYELDDGTGTLPIAVFQNANPDDNGAGDAASKATTFAEGTYVHVIGGIRAGQGANKTKNIMGFSLKAVTDFNQITAHQLDVIYSHLKQKSQAEAEKPAVGFGGNAMNPGAVNGAAQPMMMNPNAMAYGMPPMQSYGGAPVQNSSFQQPAMAGIPGLNEAQNKVLNCIRAQPDSDTGVSVQAMMNQTQMNERDVRGCVEFLMGEGHLYSTIDDDHYKFCT